MHFRSLVAGALTGGLVASASSISSPIVNTTYGLVAGGASEYRDGVSVFKGIPFAKAPTGELRWKAPVRADPWTGVKNATSFGYQCPQELGSGNSIFGTSDVGTSEDCLSLNIWTPANVTAESNLPVYVWIYGGRFTGGSGAVVTYDGSGLATKDIIVVTINYRLGPFGFFAHPELSAESGHNSSGNYGLLDMISAITWVKDEISAFGGNPEQITVGGQSAGSASALDMMWSPLSSHLISGVIAESGARGPHDPYTGSAATSYRTKAAAEASGVSIMETLNVTTIAQLRNLSVSALLAEDNLSGSVFENTQFANISTWMEPPLWRPVIDGHVLPHSYGEALRLNAHADIPILTGNNADESGASPSPGLTLSAYKQNFTNIMGAAFSPRFFALYPASNASQADASANAFYRDMSRYGTWNWARDWAAGGAKKEVFVYYYTHAPPSQEEGAFHGSELYYVFNNIPYAETGYNWTRTDYVVEERMAAYWANFIRTGNPNGDGEGKGEGNLTYFPASGERAEVMWLGDEWGAAGFADEERIAFFKDWEATLREW